MRTLGTVVFGLTLILALSGDDARSLNAESEVAFHFLEEVEPQARTESVGDLPIAFTFLDVELEPHAYAMRPHERPLQFSFLCEPNTLRRRPNVGDLAIDTNPDFADLKAELEKERAELQELKLTLRAELTAAKPKPKNELWAFMDPVKGRCAPCVVLEGRLPALSARFNVIHKSTLPPLLAAEFAARRLGYPVLYWTDPHGKQHWHQGPDTDEFIRKFDASIATK